MQNKLQDYKTIDLLGIPALSLNTNNALNLLVDSFYQFKKQGWNSSDKQILLHLNSLNLYRLRNNLELVNILVSNSYILAEGIAVKSVFNFKIADTNGTDLFPSFIEKIEQDIAIYMIGDVKSVLDSAVDNVKNNKNVRVVGSNHGFFSEKEELILIEDIKNKKPDLIVLALSCPKQEKFAYKILQNGFSPWLIWTVGALFGYLSGDTKRAPDAMLKMRLEWFYRFFANPKKEWRRVFIAYPWLIYMRLLNRKIYKN